MATKDDIIASAQLVELREKLNTLQAAHDLISEKRTGTVDDQVFYDLSALVLDKARTMYKRKLNQEALEIIKK